MSSIEEAEDVDVDNHGEENKPELYFELSVYEKDEDGTRTDEPIETTGTWNTTPHKVDVENDFVIERGIDYLIGVLENRSVNGLDH